MSPTFLLVNGPNLNRLGLREPGIYGTATLADVVQAVTSIAASYGATIHSYQSNSEGELIDFIQEQAPAANGMIINPGALAHYGYALRDCIADVNIPTVEVHISNVHKREEFRHQLVLAPVVLGQIVGLGTTGYELAMHYLLSHKPS